MSLDGLQEFERGLAPEEVSLNDMFASGEPQAESEYAYPLTAFIPGAAAEGAAIPGTAARWILPDLDAAQMVLVVKLFNVGFADKVPPGYNMLFLRVGKGNKPNPTRFQSKVWSMTHNRFEGGKQKYAVVRLLPVLQWNEERGEWLPEIAEIGKLAWDALTESLADWESNDLPARPVAVWREGMRDFKVRRIKDGPKPSEVLGDKSLLDVREYVKTRWHLTDAWLKDALDAYERAEDEVPASPLGDAKQRFSGAVQELSLEQMKGILRDHEIKVPKTKVEIIEALLDNQETVEEDVLLVSVD